MWRQRQRLEWCSHKQGMPAATGNLSITWLQPSGTDLEHLSSRTGRRHAVVLSYQVHGYLHSSPRTAAAAAKPLQSCPTLCNSIDGSPPGSPVPGILQARTLEWVAMSFSNAWKWKVKVKSLSRVRLLATPWTATHQGPPSMGFSRQEYWSGVPLTLTGKQHKEDSGYDWDSRLIFLLTP